jgi:hypothetical protein
MDRLGTALACDSKDRVCIQVTVTRRGRTETIRLIAKLDM